MSVAHTMVGGAYRSHRGLVNTVLLARREWSSFLRQLGRAWGPRRLYTLWSAIFPLIYGQGGVPSIPGCFGLAMLEILTGNGLPYRNIFSGLSLRVNHWVRHSFFAPVGAPGGPMAVVADLTEDVQKGRGLIVWAENSIGRLEHTDLAVQNR